MPKKYRVHLYDTNGAYKMHLDFDKMRDCRKLVECFPKETRPTIMVWDERIELYSFLYMKSTR